MEVTTKELRIQPGKIIDQVAHGEEVTITFRGRALARIVPVDPVRSRSEEKVQIFGMWSETQETASVDEVVRSFRNGRTF